MTTTKELQALADELTIVMPPPKSVRGANDTTVGSGVWKIAPIGSGAFALRIEYKKADGSTITVRPEKEVSGFPNTLRQSLEFLISLNVATKHLWLPV